MHSCVCGYMLCLMFVTFCAFGFSFLDHLPSTSVLKSGFSLDTTHGGMDAVIPLHEHAHCHLL